MIVGRVSYIVLGSHEHQQILNQIEFLQAVIESKVQKLSQHETAMERMAKQIREMERQLEGMRRDRDRYRRRARLS